MDAQELDDELSEFDQALRDMGTPVEDRAGLVDQLRDVMLTPRDTPAFDSKGINITLDMGDALEAHLRRGGLDEGADAMARFITAVRVYLELPRDLQDIAGLPSSAHST